MWIIENQEQSVRDMLYQHIKVSVKLKLVFELGVNGMLVARDRALLLVEVSWILMGDIGVAAAHFDGIARHDFFEKETEDRVVINSQRNVRKKVRDLFERFVENVNLVYRDVDYDTAISKGVEHVWSPLPSPWLFGTFIFLGEVSSLYSVEFFFS